MNLSISRLPLLGKINIIVALVFLVITGVETFLSAQYAKDQYLRIAQEQVTDLTTMYFDSLNTMMLTGTMNQRAILRGKLLARPQVLEARVIRGNPVKEQFGEGFRDEQVVDELDLRGLNGEPIAVVTRGRRGRELTIITPFRATENTRGVNCLQCHNVPSGAVNGAIRVKFSLAQMDGEIDSEIFRNVIVNFVLFLVGIFIINVMLRRWLIKPVGRLLAVVQQRAQGDITARVDIESHDEIGRLGEAFNTMAANVNAVKEREHSETMELQLKVDSLQSVMKKVTEGDFDVKIGFSGDGAIGELASSLQIMIDTLKQILDEKHATVENIKSKVDNILHLTDQVSEGDLTGSIVIDQSGNNDAIDRLGRGVQGMISNLSSLVAHIQNSGSQVNSTSTELSGCMEAIAGTAERQANTTLGLSVTATNISSTIHDLLETMNDVASMAESTTASAINSHSGLKNLEVLIQQVVASAEIVSEKLEILDERARNISAVVVTIAKVADQTNLLSLNAALEAEKAGEYGRGFAVVATEIRRLADQAAISTLDIEQMIIEMQESVTTGVQTMKGFTDLVKNSVDEVGQVSEEQGEIILLVETMGPRFESLHKSMQTQSLGAEKIHVAMNQLNEEAQQTVSSLKLSGETFKILNESNNLLQNSVSKFKVKN